MQDYRKSSQCKGLESNQCYVIKQSVFKLQVMEILVINFKGILLIVKHYSNTSDLQQILLCLNLRWQALSFEKHSTAYLCNAFGMI